MQSEFAFFREIVAVISGCFEYLSLHLVFAAQSGSFRNKLDSLFEKVFLTYVTVTASHFIR